MVKKYLNYIIFGAVVLVVVGLAVNHSRRMRSLVDALASRDAQARSQAATQLITMEQFMDAITGEPVEMRVQAAEALEVLGTPEAVKQAIVFLKDPDKPVRDRLVVTLQKIGAKSEKHIAELVNGLKDGDSNVRKGTMQALTDSQDGIGPKPGIVAAIVDIMKREAGARGPGGDVLGSALFVKNGSNKESVPLLLALTKEKDEGVRVGAVEALGKTGDPSAVAPLKALMAKDTAQVRRVAIGSIALIADRSGEDALTEAIRNPNDDNEARAQAAAGLGKIGTPTAIATLINALDDDDLKLRSAAVAALARAGRPNADGPVNRQVLNTLIASLRDPRGPVRLGAAQALQPIDAPDANPGLIALLQKPAGAGGDADMEADIRAAAAAALGFSGNRTAVGPLVAAMKDESAVVADAATEALAVIGPAATDELIALLKQNDERSLYAAQALAKQGAAALPALTQAARGSDPVKQRWAAVALGDLGIAEARPLLEELEKSGDPDVAYVAQQQLSRLGRAQTEG